MQIRDKVISLFFPLKNFFISSRVDLEIFSLLQNIGNLAQEFFSKNQKSKSIYVVGGFVRDLFLVENFKSDEHDIDLVVESDGLKFAEYLYEKIGNPNRKLKQHDHFGTGK